MLPPRTPRRFSLPAPLAPSARSKSGRGQATFRQKVGGGVLENPWIGEFFSPKSLMLEQKCLTGYAEFSTCHSEFSTCSAFFSTCRFFWQPRLYLSISLFLKEEEKKEEQARRKGRSTCSDRCLFFNPRVCTPIHGFFVDSVGRVFRVVAGIDGDSGRHPRIHGLFYPPAPRMGAV